MVEISKSRKGVIGELTLASQYIKKGYWVAMSLCPQSPFDLVVVDNKGNCKLIDAKTTSLRKAGRQKGMRINRKLNSKQKKMKVRIEYVNTKTTI
tara:strand:+ start:1242 stop:1526 length:285 start_codon:yes stop_codon:yes gene_type:complete